MARAPKITWERLHSMIESGAGCGFGESYQPWIQIKRWNPSPKSTQVIKALPPYRRACHFLSKTEYRLALLFSWAGCEFREQFPLWPWPHPHPETGRSMMADRFLKESIGTINLCETAGIKHGVFPGTQIPFIWTIDFALHLPWIDDIARSSCLVSVKPSQKINTADVLSRTLEKLEIERRYADQIGAGYFVGDLNNFSSTLFANLDFLQASAFLPKRNAAYKTREDFLASHGHLLKEQPLRYTLDVLAKDFNCDPQKATLIRNHLLWHQFIDCDLSKTLSSQKKPCPDGKSFKARVRANLERPSCLF